MKRTIQSITFVLAAAALSALAMPAAAQVSTFITITNHPEEALTWCGAATGQMVVSGYPGGACVQIQADMWDAIQAAKVEPSWDTDPAGLRSAMTTLCPLPAGGHWSIFSDPSAASLMHSVARWMKLRHYPVAAVLNTNPHNALVSHREHWVTIKGIVTDLDPTTNPSVTLQFVFITDQPANLGDPAVDRFLTGAQWYSEFQAVVNASSIYNGKFVAIIEPPERPGRADARVLPVTGVVLSADRALAAARNAARLSALTNTDSFREISQMQPQTPILVNPGRRAYYIVPFARAGSAPSMAILINAYSGDFMEAGRFAPRPMIAERDAVARAARLLGRESLPTAKATLVPTDRDLPYFPAWRVNVDGEDVVIQQNGGLRRALPELLVPQPQQ
jgi:hypothetical protein